MAAPLPELKVGESARQRLADKLRVEAPIFNFERDPALASLCTCLALQFEVGREDFDRLSPFFGVAIRKGEGNPWNSQIVVRNSSVGIRFTPKDGRRLEVRHEDFRFLIDPSSFEGGELRSILIFPHHVAKHFEKRGVELVIVRDWILATTLNPNPNDTVPYLVANPWEVENNIARTQIELMRRQQLAFFGTHDIADHLLGCDGQRLAESKALVEQAFHTYEKVFSRTSSDTAARLHLSYFIGVLLDDMAQPRWYGSRAHAHLLRLALLQLSDSRLDVDRGLEFRNAFSQLVARLRSQKASLIELETLFLLFFDDLILGSSKVSHAQNCA